MPYQAATTAQNRETAKLRPATHANTTSTAMPFIFGLRRRAMQQQKDTSRPLRDELDPAVSNYATD